MKNSLITVLNIFSTISLIGSSNTDLAAQQTDKKYNSLLIRL